MRRIVAVLRFPGRPGCRVTIDVIGASRQDFSLPCSRRFAVEPDKGHALASPICRYFAPESLWILKLSQTSPPETNTVKPAVEPVSLRLPRDLLVLQPLQGHLDLEPVLLQPGQRCAIGSGDECAVRLKKSDLVEPVHCVLDVTEKQVRLAEWKPAATWLNDRLVLEPCVLVAGDRIAVGPFDFRLRPASAEELLYLQLVESSFAESNQVENVLRLKRAIENHGTKLPHSPVVAHADQPEADPQQVEQSGGMSFGSAVPDRFTNHIFKVLTDLQSQLLALQEKSSDAEEMTGHPSGERVASGERATSAPGDSAQHELQLAWTRERESYELELAQLRKLLESQQAEMNRQQAAHQNDRVSWEAERAALSRQVQVLESELANLRTQRDLWLAEKRACELLAEQRNPQETGGGRLDAQAQGQQRLSGESQAGVRFREPVAAVAALPRTAATSLGESRAAKTANLVAERVKSEEAREVQNSMASEPDPTLRPMQTLLTLGSFCLSALLLGVNWEAPLLGTLLGWGTAAIGTISTVDLCFRRLRRPLH